MSGVLFQCEEKVKDKDYDKLIDFITHNCKEIMPVNLRGDLKPMAIKRYIENYYGFIFHLPQLDNILRFYIGGYAKIEYSEVLHDYELKYVARICNASDHLRITIPTRILPSNVDLTGRAAKVELSIGEKTFEFKAKVGAGRKQGRVVYYFIRVPKRLLRKTFVDENHLINREVKVTILIPNP